jgi:hypothetical protein
MPPHPSLAPRVTLDAPLPGERDFCFAIEGSPPGCGRSLPTADGRIRLVHELEGTVVSVGTNRLDLGSAVGLVRVRLGLPSGIELAPLLGHRLALSAVHVVGRSTCLDLRLRDERGGLVLWAFDGLVPGGDARLGACWDPERGRLGLVAEGRAPVWAPDGFGFLELEGAPLRFLGLRRSSTDAAFVLLR